VELEWDLKNIYKSIDDEEFKKDFKEYQNEIKKINNWAEKNLNSHDNEIKKLEEYIILKNRICKYNKLYIYLQLSSSTDTSNQKINKLLNRIDNINSELTQPDIMLKQFLKGIDNLDSLISKSNILKEHKYLLNSYKRESTHILLPEQEKIISKMKNTGSSMWQKQWEQMVSNIEVDIKINDEQKKLPLSVIRNYAYSSDRELRRNAYFSELEAYKKIDTAAAFSLNGIKGEVITISKLKNYSSPLEMTVLEARMDLKMLDTMFAAIKESIPKIQKYFIKKAEIIGHKNGLPFYDLFAPVSKKNLNFNYEQAKEFIISNFNDFSVKLGNFAKKAFENNWIDVMPKKGKLGGAFCEAIHSIKESRILTNFYGTFNDVVTLAHELGHAYHDSCLYDETELNSVYPMPIAETASTLCETIITNAALKTATKEEAFIIIENDLSGIAQVIIDIYSRFLFEDEVFKSKENGILSVNELNEIMMQSQIKAYGNSLNHNYLHKYMWICKPHYYDADFNYYNYPYAFGLLLAKGLYSLYLKQKDDFIPLYDKFLNSTGKNDLYDVAKIVGIDLYDIEFWRSSLKMIENEIESWQQI